jgi:hypothetical protein
MSADGIVTNEEAGLGASQGKKRWSDFSPQQQTAIIVAAIIELILTTLALRDLSRRSRSEVRGPKVLWVFASAVQPVGPILYFLVGRRSPS